MNNFTPDEKHILIIALEDLVQTCSLNFVDRLITDKKTKHELGEYRKQSYKLLLKLKGETI